MEKTLEAERGEARALLPRSSHENDYAPWSGADLVEARKVALEQVPVPTGIRSTLCKRQLLDIIVSMMTRATSGSGAKTA